MLRVNITKGQKILVISLVAAAVAEAPYHLPRPAAHAPSFNYAQPPPLPPPLSPTILQHLAPLPQLPHPHLPTQAFHSHPVSQPHSVQSGYSYPQPAPQPLTSHHQTAIQPQISYQSLPHPAPQPISVSYLRPQQIYQQPSISYSQPQVQLPVTPIRPLPALVTPQQPSPITYYQPQLYTPDHGYSFQLPQTQSSSLISQFPLQTQSHSSIPIPSLSSYQADSNYYNTAAQSQTHREALDSTVVNRVQNIIKENEHTSAKEAGFLSLVSGVTLENAKPSVEISSFVQNSHLPSQSQTSSFSTSSSSLSSSAALSPSGSYSLPSISTGSQSSSNTGSLNFLPNTQPATSYGAPN
ncbi:unnamed protein product [Parnassius apollo]|uniref:(apollo) hypothetical protein n=1 Tax=Parnassius apollo TaxID=110799 RepID=A0A8S3WJC2_PARAO|nr:unnamed protein product [Parnassius apollo]